jgi:hypothetical protein
MINSIPLIVSPISAERKLVSPSHVAERRL